MIIDVHGHFTTVPQALRDYRERQVQAVAKGGKAPTETLTITDDQIRESIVNNQLKVQKARGTDVTVFSPIASLMGHHVGDAELSARWSATANDLIHRVCQLFPDNFVGVGQLPQSPGVPAKNCVAELERCVNELGFVGVNLNPDPTGGYWRDPALTDRWYYPLYEKMVELDVPAMVHVTSSCNPAVHHTGAHYLNGDTTAFMQFLTSDLFRDFPTLKFVIPHGGGAVPFHWGRYRGLAQDMKRLPLKEHLLQNVFFDTCVYHQPGVSLMRQVLPIDNILFASEMIGAVKSIDPETGHHFDDTKRYIDALGLSEADRTKIFSGNARRVYPRLDARLKAIEARRKA